MSHPATPTYQLIEARLGETLAEYVAKNRPHTSWRDMAAHLRETTGVPVSHESLRSWFADRITVEVTVSA
jgi:hypothetical protein